MPSPIPRLLLPRKGVLSVPSDSGDESPQPPYAPRNTTSDQDERAQALALEQWANELTVFLGQLQTGLTQQVSGTQSTASAVYVDLATAGPAIGDGVDYSLTGSTNILELPAGFAVMVIVTGGLSGNGLMSYEIQPPAGFPLVAASDNKCIFNANSLGMRASAVSLYTTVAPGKYIFKAKYRSTSGAANFTDRQIIVSGV